MTPRGKYDGSKILENPDEVAPLALAVLIASGGNASEASRRMQREHGIKVSRRHIERWRDQDPLRYEDMRRELAPQLEARLSGDVLDSAIRATEVERQYIEETAANVGTTKDPVATSTVARNMKQIVTQSVDKRALMDGKPTVIRETRNVDELLRTLERLGIVKQDVIEATSEDA